MTTETTTKKNKITVEVRADESPVRLDRFLKRKLPEITQGIIQKLARKGQIRVDGQKATPSTRLEEGAEVTWPAFLNDFQKPESSNNLTDALRREAQDMVLYEDDQMLVLNKPPGIASQGGNGITKHIDMILDAFEGIEGERPKLVHRIDKETSGILLVARSSGIAAKLAESFRKRSVKKEYWAVVVGNPEVSSGVIDAPLIKVGKGAGSLMMVADKKDKSGLAAKTDFETIDRAGKKLTWLSLSPLSGRTHQLRVHCEAMGTPILGDDKYGDDKTQLSGFADRLHLHARSIEIPHPKGGTLKVSAPLPKHMEETFKNLGFYPPAMSAPEYKK